MAQARYTILAPNLPGLDQAIYKYLSDGPIRTRAVNIVAGHPNNIIIAWADENPETDSHFKQVGTYVAEAANEPTVAVIRENKSGAQTWEMKNNHYVPHTVHEELSRPSPDNGNHENGFQGDQQSTHNDLVGEMFAEPTSVDTAQGEDYAGQEMPQVSN